MPANPLAEMIGYLTEFLSILEACFTADSPESLQKLRIKCHAVRTPFWDRFKIPLHAHRDLFITAAPFLHKFPDDRNVIENAVRTVVSLATMRAMNAPAPELSTNDDEALRRKTEAMWKQYERQGDDLLNAKSLLVRLEQLASLWPAGEVETVTQRRRSARWPTQRKRDKKTEARDKWIYKKCFKGIPHLTILAEFRRIAPKRKWAIVSSKQRIRQIGNEYADDNGLARPPARQNL